MKKTATGSGITQRTHYSLGDDPITMADAEQIMTLFEAMKEGRYKPIHDKACKILTEAELPISAAVRYQREHPEKWKRMPMIDVYQPDSNDQPYLWKGFKYRCYCWGLPSGSIEHLAFLADYVIRIRGFAEDSPQGYAARMIDCLAHMSLAAACEDFRACTNSAFDLGMLVKESGMKVRLEPSVMAYQRSRRGGKTGGEKAAQSRKQKAELRQKQVEDEARRLVAEGKQKHQLARLIKRRLGIPERTVRRHLKKSAIQ